MRAAAELVKAALDRGCAAQRAAGRGLRGGCGAVVLGGSLVCCPPATAGGPIYLSTTTTGLPSYSSEPSDAGSLPYLVLGDPPARPRQPRLDSPRITPRAAVSGAYAKVAGLAGPAGVVGMAGPVIHELTAAASRAYGVPQALLLAVMHAESRFDPAARSPVGAVGLMQIMPTTGARYGVRLGLADPVRNVDVGTRYLKDLLELFHGNAELAVAAYNSGEGAVLGHGGRIPPFAETRAYVPKVMALYARYTGDRSPRW